MFPESNYNRYLAIHEAGHAVMARYFGYGPLFVSIEPNRFDEDTPACCGFLSSKALIDEKAGKDSWENWQAMEKYSLYLPSWVCCRMA